jgi:replication-associated recombination protein RarA
LISSEDVGPADHLMAVLIHDLYDHYRDMAKAPGRPQERIILAHAVIALCQAPHSRAADDLNALVSHQLESEGLRREIPDEALDLHTRRGKAKGRGLEHWAAEGCQLAHEVEGLNPWRERALEMRRRYGRLKPKAKP